MRHVTYAGEKVVTTDDVAEVLVALTAAIAREGQAEAVTIPIIVEGSRRVGDAELVIGLGNDVLSAPVDWSGEEPDFSASAEKLRSHRSFPRPHAEEDEEGEDVVYLRESDRYWDPDLEGFSNT